MCYTTNKEVKPNKQAKVIPNSLIKRRCMQKFWMVYVEGKSSPTVCHYTRQEALNEMERLARQQSNIGKSVVLLEASTYCRVELNPAIWSEVE